MLEADRFAGRFRDGGHLADTSNLRRRVVKEQRVKCDNPPRFPERQVYTVNYPLSDPEARYSARDGVL